MQERPSCSSSGNQPDPPDPDVVQLIEAARGGSVDALVRLISRVRHQMLRVARQECPADVLVKVDASDIVQDTAFDAIRGFSEFSGASPAQFYGWLRAILRHKIANTLRQHDQAQRRSVRKEVRIADAVAGDGGFPAVSQHSPEASAIRQEEAAAVAAAMESLPQVTRDVINKRHWQGLSFQQIAEEVGKSEAAVRKIWHRGIRVLGEKVRSSLASSENDASGTPDVS